MKFEKSLVWFRRDLRAFDHAALHHALTTSKTVYCAFVYDDAILAKLPRHDRRVAFIHASIAELDAELRTLGGCLLVRHAHARSDIVRLAAELDVQAVFANEDYEPQAIDRDVAVADALEAAGRQLLVVKDQLIFAKDEVRTLAGGRFSVFTPYKNAWLKRMHAAPECLAPWQIAPHAARLAPAQGAPALPSLAALGFEPVDLAAVGIVAGMRGGAATFESFIARMAAYDEARNYPAIDGTSTLSIHLRFGTVSIRHLVRTVNQLIASGAGGAGAPVWLSELIWREFYAQILFHNPHVVERAFKPAYDAVAWEAGPQAEAAFAAWCEGRTGYPLVDAAMAQINQTGFMHNRLRMVTASFLVKDLGIDWRWGEQYFALHLNDFELASNNGGWQWASSSGCDAQPYFRIFNPVTQSQKFDKSGQFIRHWLPQLKKLDDKQIHAPWEWPAAPRGDYPAPMVDHAQARATTLVRYAVVKAAGEADA
ncbi:cryptochrome/photolyase family protein [Massilia sp. DWR3-1-1]|uniref:cryptochrome/photolyase family protein n=1 Tax=Massilia sp. DWR3-1-1 TaxID=2804559 RepID=UPI003CF9D720